MKNLYSSVIEFIDSRIKSQSSSALKICWTMKHNALMINAYTIDSPDKANSADTRLDTMLEEAALTYESIIRMKSLVWLRRRAMTFLEDESTYSDVMNFIIGTRSHIASMRGFDFHNTFARTTFDCALDIVDKLSEHISKKMDSKEEEEYCNEE